jgi:serine/threonine protein kinase
MAPEMIYRKPYNPQSTDVRSLAIVYCCMVLGRFPWQEASLQDQKFAQFADRSASSHQAQTKRQNNNVEAQEYHIMAAELSAEGQGEHTDKLSEKTSICIVVEVRPSPDIDNTSNLPPPGKPSQQFSEESWNVVRGMLHLDGQKRASMQQLEQSDWVRKSRVCSRLQEDETCTHTHV